MCPGEVDDRYHHDKRIAMIPSPPDFSGPVGGEFPETTMTGTTVAHRRILQKFGEGGMGVV
jgi:hypothetical protein